LRGDQTVDKGLKDKEAQEISDAVTIVQGRKEHVMAIEGEIDVSYEELQAGGVHETGFVVNPHGLGNDVYVERDDIEVTNGFHTNNGGIARKDLTTAQPGSTNLRVEGEGVRHHGIVPEMYAVFVAANVPPAKLPEYDVTPIDPFMDPVNPGPELRAMIKRLARDNGRELNDVEVSIMYREREDAIFAALQQIQQEHAGFTITRITDGTVDPTRIALAGRKTGKYLISLGTAKSTEGTHNGFEAGVMNSREPTPRGAVYGLRYTSKNVNNLLDDTGQPIKGVKAHNHANRLRWTSKEENDIRTFRPKDAEEILTGKKLFTASYFAGLGDIEVFVARYTDGPWDNLAGAQVLDADTVRVTTTRLSSKAAREQGADLWVEVDDVKRSDVNRVLAQAPWVLAEPAAARLDAVDPNRHMQGTILINPAAFSAQAPGGWLAVERALKERSVKVIVDARPTTSGEGDARQVTVVLAATQEESGAFSDKAHEVTRGIEGTSHEPVPFESVATHDADGKSILAVQFFRSHAGEAAQAFLNDPEVAKRAEQTATASVARRFATINGATALPGSTEGATHLKPEMISVAVTTPKETVTAAIGPREWLKTVPDTVETKVVLEAPTEQENKQVRSPAAAFVAAAVGKRDSELVARVKVDLTDAGYVPQLESITDQAVAANEAYRERLQSFEAAGGKV
jgi:hypothetical protein